MADPSLQSIIDALAGSQHPFVEMGEHLHDPSAGVLASNGWRMMAATGKENNAAYNCGLETWFQPPGSSQWTPGQCLLSTKPAWVLSRTPQNGGASGRGGVYWAPSLADARTMYYSVSAGFGNGRDAQSTCIGLLRATGVPPSMRWADQGAPLSCTTNYENNGLAPASIDPAYFLDPSDRAPYLAFGGGQIWLMRLDPTSGFAMNNASWSAGGSGGVYTHLSGRAPPNAQGETWVEAPFLYAHGGWYYLFLNWYACCRGAESTYEIRVGRATSVSGPYYDAAGQDLRTQGGTLLLDRQGTVLSDTYALASSRLGSARPPLRLTHTLAPALFPLRPCYVRALFPQLWRVCVCVRAGMSWILISVAQDTLVSLATR